MMQFLYRLPMTLSFCFLCYTVSLSPSSLFLSFSLSSLSLFDSTSFREFVSYSPHTLPSLHPDNRLFVSMHLQQLPPDSLLHKHCREREGERRDTWEINVLWGEAIFTGDESLSLFPLHSVLFAWFRSCLESNDVGLMCSSLFLWKRTNDSFSPPGSVWLPSRGWSLSFLSSLTF